MAQESQGYRPPPVFSCRWPPRHRRLSWGQHDFRSQNPKEYGRRAGQVDRGRPRTPRGVEAMIRRRRGLTLPSAINLGQIRSVDRGRLVKRLGALDAPTMRRVDEAPKISLGLNEL